MAVDDDGGRGDIGFHDDLIHDERGVEEDGEDAYRGELLQPTEPVDLLVDLDEITNPNDDHRRSSDGGGPGTAMVVTRPTSRWVTGHIRQIGFCIDLVFAVRIHTHTQLCSKRLVVVVRIDFEMKKLILHVRSLPGCAVLSNRCLFPFTDRSYRIQQLQCGREQAVGTDRDDDL
jgi:hypothetical protein